MAKGRKNGGRGGAFLFRLVLLLDVLIRLIHLDNLLVDIMNLQQLVSNLFIRQRAFIEM